MLWGGAGRDQGPAAGRARPARCPASAAAASFISRRRGWSRWWRRRRQSAVGSRCVRPAPSRLIVPVLVKRDETYAGWPRLCIEKWNLGNRSVKGRKKRTDTDGHQIVALCLTPGTYADRVIIVMKTLLNRVPDQEWSRNQNQYRGVETNSKTDNI